MNKTEQPTTTTAYPEKKGLDQNLLKYLAVAFMVLNHIATIFLSEKPIADLLIGLGFFTFPTMCYFLVEGFIYTHNKKKYALRLLMFALISQIPFALAFTSSGNIFEFKLLNIMFTLFICFLMLWGLMTVKNDLMRLLVFGAAIGLSYFCDWGLLAPIYALIFLWAYGSRKKLKTGFLIILCLSIFEYLLESSVFGGSYDFSVYGLLSDISGIALSAVVLIWFYNGKRSTKHKQFNKWFFYIFYPAHLLLFGLIKIFIYR